MWVCWLLASLPALEVQKGQTHRQPWAELLGLLLHSRIGGVWDLDEALASYAPLLPEKAGLIENKRINSCPQSTGKKQVQDVAAACQDGDNPPLSISHPFSNIYQKIFGSYSTAAICKAILQFATSSKSYFVMDEAYKLRISSNGLSKGFLFHEPAESQ